MPSGGVHAMCVWSMKGEGGGGGVYEESEHCTHTE